MGKKILLVGGGGHCRSVLDCIRLLSVYDEMGIIEKTRESKSTGMEAPVVGTDSDLPRLLSEGWTEAVVTVGSVGNTSVRRRIFENLKELGFILPAIIDPSAIVASDVIIGEGAFVGKRAVVNAGSHIGAGAIINTGAVIEHDCSIGDFSHISPGTVLCGQVVVGKDTHVGAGSVVRQQITIGSGSLIGIGSVVVKDIPDSVKAYGNPCKVVDE